MFSLKESEMEEKISAEKKELERFKKNINVSIELIELRIEEIKEEIEIKEKEIKSLREEKEIELYPKESTKKAFSEIIENVLELRKILEKKKKERLEKNQDHMFLFSQESK